MEQRLSAVLVPDDRENLHVTRVGCHRKLWKRRLVLAVLVASGVLLALLVCEVASVLQGLWGQGKLTEVTVATLAPIIAMWVGLRALLGFYPGYGFCAGR